MECRGASKLQALTGHVFIFQTDTLHSVSFSLFPPLLSLSLSLRQRSRSTRGQEGGLCSLQTQHGVRAVVYSRRLPRDHSDGPCRPHFRAPLHPLDHNQGSRHLAGLCPQTSALLGGHLLIPVRLEETGITDTGFFSLTCNAIGCQSQCLVCFNIENVHRDGLELIYICVF